MYTTLILWFTKNWKVLLQIGIALLIAAGIFKAGYEFKGYFCAITETGLKNDIVNLELRNDRQVLEIERYKSDLQTEIDRQDLLVEKERAEAAVRIKEREKQIEELLAREIPEIDVDACKPIDDLINEELGL